mmetsp:Transcript_47237/g.112393  ORF Transcript_47237/g.112393 Transcript_47237/m.112393 type:complete len:214 (+) Transcript_47237:243-884(+)
MREVCLRSRPCAEAPTAQSLALEWATMAILLAPWLPQRRGNLEHGGRLGRTSPAGISHRHGHRALLRQLVLLLLLHQEPPELTVLPGLRPLHLRHEQALLHHRLVELLLEELTQALALRLPRHLLLALPLKEARRRLLELRVRLLQVLRLLLALLPLRQQLGEATPYAKLPPHDLLERAAPIRRLAATLGRHRPEQAECQRALCQAPVVDAHW